MRKIIAFLVSTVDGYYEGPKQEFDWPLVDDEFNEFAIEQLRETDTLLFGRRTYEGMAAYWPTAAAQEDDPTVAALMNTHPKIVISRTLDRADWANTRLVKDDVVGELTKLKEGSGRYHSIFGSSELTTNLLRLGLVDELRIMVNPIVLGGGNSLFRTATERTSLTLLNVRPFASGNVLLSYRPAGR